MIGYSSQDNSWSVASLGKHHGFPTSNFWSYQRSKGWAWKLRRSKIIKSKYIMCSQFLLNYFHLFCKWYKMARFCEKYRVWYLPSNDLKIATKRNLKGQSVHLEIFVCINFGFFTEHLENAKIEWAAQPFIVDMTLKKTTNICNESSRPDNLCSVQLVPEFRFTLFPKSSEGLLSSCTKYLKECKTDKISFSIFLIWKIKELNLGEGTHFARTLNSNFLKGSTHTAWSDDRLFFANMIKTN